MSHTTQSVGAGTMEPPRRSFFYKLFTVVVGSVLPIPAIVAAGYSLVAPLFGTIKKKQMPSGSETIEGVDGFFKTLSSDNLSADPQLFQIIADKKDAWNTYPKAPIGAVYVQKTSDARLNFEKDWKAETSLKAALEKVEAEKKNDLFRELLETEFSLVRREKERHGHHWTEADTAATIARYQQAYPKEASIVAEVGHDTIWEGGLRVFNVSCPHAGCAVDFTGKDYFCPCHNSQFASNGARSPTSPSARDLDSLDYVVDKNGIVLVRYQDFKAGEAAKHPV